MADNEIISIVKQILNSYSKNAEHLIPILQDIQKKLKYLPDQAMLEVSKYTKISESKIYGVASFYAQFRFTPIGKKHITVCRGTACHVRGGAKILEAVKKHIKIDTGEVSSDLEFSLDTVACIGCCGLSPCIMINDKVYGKMTPKKIAKLFSKG